MELKLCQPMQISVKNHYPCSFMIILKCKCVKHISLKNRDFYRKLKIQQYFMHVICSFQIFIYCNLLVVATKVIKRINHGHSSLCLKSHYIDLTYNYYVFAVIGETVTFVSPNGLTFLSNGEW